MKPTITLKTYSGTTTTIHVRAAPPTRWTAAKETNAARECNAVAHELVARILRELPLVPGSAWPTVALGEAWSGGASARVDVIHDGDPDVIAAIARALEAGR